MREETTANREYKSTMFCMLFREKKELLELYNAVNHSCYENEEDLQIVTLENAIYMNMKNDLAFLIDLHMNLYEHQSTYNPNMPLRDLFYVSKEYQNLVKDRSLYSTKMIKLPTPRFLVFYNGTETRPEVERLKLSDAYETKEEAPELELIVTVLNINEGNNGEILNNCRTLKEYMQYVSCVRYFLNIKRMNLDEAVESAVDECIERGILEDFLKKHKSEAIAMCVYEWNEVEKEKLRKEEREIGFEEGIKQGKEILLDELRNKMMEKGFSQQEIEELLKL